MTEEERKEQQDYFERIRPLMAKAREAFDKEEDARHKEFVKSSPCPYCDTTGKLVESPNVMYTEPAIYTVTCEECNHASSFSEVGIPTFDGEKFLSRDIVWLERKRLPNEVQELLLQLRKKKTSD